MSSSSMAKTSAESCSSVCVKNSGAGCPFLAHHAEAACNLLKSSRPRLRMTQRTFKSECLGWNSSVAAEPYSITDSRLPPAAFFNLVTRLVRSCSAFMFLAPGVFLCMGICHQPPPAPPPPEDPPPKPPKPPPPPPKPPPPQPLPRLPPNLDKNQNKMGTPRRRITKRRMRFPAVKCISC